jgi:hypothetical protein
MNGTEWLAGAQRDGVTLDEALAACDALPPVSLAEVIGRWRGSGLPSGHPFDGMLEAFGWYGKAFLGAESAHPLLFGEDGKLVSVDPRFLPVALATKLHLQSNRLAALAFRAGEELLATTKPTARLRMTEYRGQLSATMLYDRLPINDVFRRIDADTLLGIMDYREFELPFFFVLRRVGARVGHEQAAQEQP